MKLSKTNTLLLTLTSLLLVSGVAFIKPKAEVSAGPRPTNINMSTLSEDGINNYYSKAGGFINVRGDALLSNLHEVIKDHNEYDFDSSTDRFIFKIIDRNWDLSPLTSAQLRNFNYSTDMPYIHKLYADYNNDSATAHKFNDPAIPGRVSFDKEHIWAQSLGDFGRKYGAGSDFHALWPSDIKGNQAAHSNYNFGTPATSIASYINDNGTYVGRNGYIPGQPNKVFEPLLEYRGDIARAMMYMAARYYVWEDDEHPKLQLVNGSPAAVTASPSQPGLAGNLATLLEWHEADPVSPYEKKRNNLLYYNYQQNRNPFIDRPEWARIAFDTNYIGGGASSDGSPTSNDEELLGISVSGAPTSLKLGEDYAWDTLSITAHYKDAGDLPLQKSNPNLTIDYPDTSKLGEQSLNVGFTYGDFTRYASHNVFVTNEDVSVGEAPAFATDLFISEYIEGTSNNKYLELYNGTGQSINLSDYRLQLFANGASTPNNNVQLSGTLAHDTTIVYKHSSAALVLPAGVTATTISVTNYNGDDAIALFKISTSAYIDIFGQIGYDPGTKWENNGVSTLDRTLVRKPSVFEGITVNPTNPPGFDPSLEWIEYSTDTVSNLGSHTMSATAESLSKEEQSQAWATYFLDVTSGYCEEGEGYNLAGSLWDTLASEYAFMDSTSKALFKTAIANGDNITDITGAKARYMLLVDTYPALKANNFMVDETNSVIYETIRTDELVGTNETSMFFLVILSLITLSGYFVLTHKRKDVSK